MATSKKSQSASRSSKKTTSSSSSRSTSRNNGSDNEAIAQLTEDHARVKKMFKQYDKLAQSESDESERQELASMICAELTAHATAEEEIFYPAARKVLNEVDLLDEAEVEHASAKELIAQIQESSPDDELFDALDSELGTL